VTLKIGQDGAGHQGVGRDAIARPTRGGADGEEDVRRLRLPVGRPRLVEAEGELDVVEHHRRSHVRARADGHDARGSVGSERIVEADGQREVTEMVRRELQLPPLGRVLFGGRHDAGVVDQQVQRSLPRGDKRGDRRAVSQLEPSDMNVPVAGAGADVGGDLPARIQIAHRQSDLDADAGQCPRRLHTDAGGRAGDDRPRARKINSIDHVGRRGMETERCHDA
jgi:hypothetical protein